MVDGWDGRCAHGVNIEFTTSETEGREKKAKVLHPGLRSLAVYVLWLESCGVDFCAFWSFTYGFSDAESWMGGVWFKMAEDV